MIFLQDIDYNENDGYRIILKDRNDFLLQRLTEYYEENKRDLYESKKHLKELRIGLLKEYIHFSGANVIRESIHGIMDAKESVKVLKQERKQLIKKINSLN